MCAEALVFGLDSFSELPAHGCIPAEAQWYEELSDHREPLAGEE